MDETTKIGSIGLDRNKKQDCGRLGSSPVSLKFNLQAHRAVV